MNLIIENAIITGFIISILFSFLGNIVLWKKYSYFSDGLAHSCLLGVLIHYIFNIELLYAVYLNALIFALFVRGFSNHYNKNLVTLIIAQGFLALSIVLSSLFDNNINITEFFLGDILFVNKQDIYILASLCVVTMVWFYLNYKSLLIICISPDIAKSYNIHIALIEFSYLIMLATVIAITIKILGSLLVSSLLLIPPAIANLFSRNPIQMLRNTCLLSVILYYSGLYISFTKDLPTSPVIVLISFISFIIIRLGKNLLTRRAT